MYSCHLLSVYDSMEAVVEKHRSVGGEKRNLVDKTYFSSYPSSHQYDVLNEWNIQPSYLCPVLKEKGGRYEEKIRRCFVLLLMYGNSHYSHGAFECKARSDLCHRQ